MQRKDISWCGRWRRLTVMTTATVAALVVAPVTSAAAVPVPQPEAAPAPPFVTGTWTVAPGLDGDTRDFTAAAGCLASSTDPRLAGSWHTNTRRVVGASHTECSERTTSIKTRVELYRYNNGWKLVALEVGEVKGLLVGGVRVEKKCGNSRDAYFWVHGVHRVIFNNGYVGTGTSGSPVTRLGCLA
jgi:hypothetical protein